MISSALFAAFAASVLERDKAFTFSAVLYGVVLFLLRHRVIPTSYISLLYGYSMILLYNHSLILLYKIEQTKLSLLY